MRGRPARIPGSGPRCHRIHQPYRRFVHFHSCGCPVGVEGAPESNCSLRFSRLSYSPPFQLRNRRTSNLLPRGISCTQVAHRQRPLDSRAF